MAVSDSMNLVVRVHISRCEYRPHRCSYRSVKLMSSMGSSSNPSGIIWGDTEVLTPVVAAAKLLSEPLSNISPEFGLLFPPCRKAFISGPMLPGVVSFCKVLDLLRLRGEDGVDSRREKECGVWSVWG